MGAHCGGTGPGWSRALGLPEVADGPTPTENCSWPRPDRPCCARPLPRFARPRYIEVVEALPKTLPHKVRKQELRIRAVTSSTSDRSGQPRVEVPEPPTIDGMDFDRYTVVLLVTPNHPPQLSEEEADRLQDAHLSHLADLHDRGVLLAAGPLGDPSGRRTYRGLSILRCEPDEAFASRARTRPSGPASSSSSRCRGCCRPARCTSPRRRSRDRPVTCKPHRSEDRHQSAIGSQMSSDTSITSSGLSWLGSLGARTSPTHTHRTHSDGGSGRCR